MERENELQFRYRIIAIIFACAETMLINFAKNTFFRGGVEIGVGIEFPNKGGIYSLALNDAYHIESKYAEYPRVLVGDKLAKLIQEKEKVNSEPCSSISERISNFSKSAITKDKDNRFIIDFLGEAIAKATPERLLQQSQNYIREGLIAIAEQYNKSLNEGNNKLACRYEWLKNYYFERFSNWRLNQITIELNNKQQNTKPPMELIRFYCNPIAKPSVELVDTEAHHLLSVRRLKTGDKVELFDGQGTLATAELTETKNKKVTLKIEDLKITQKPAPQIIIAVSIPKGERFDLTITKCTELGIDRITPVIFERTVKQPKNPKAADRWQKLAIAAAKQSRNLFLPKIDKPKSLPEALDMLKKDFPQSNLLVGSPDPKAPSLFNQMFSDADIIAVVGPEGGLTDKELTFLKNQNAEPVRLTDTILRIETAAIAFAAILTAKRI